MLRHGLLLLLCWPLLTAAQTFENAGQPPLLVELYTSEGCSSCPPADAYLSELLDDPGLWQQRVPMAFHVDYWNYLGWEDRLASEAFSKRQRYMKGIGAMKAVYTPGWLVDGQEWRGYFHRGALPKVSAREGGWLMAVINDGQVEVDYTPLQEAPGGYWVQGALLGFDITTEVEAGENRGQTLEHQFVVLEHHYYSADNPRVMKFTELDGQVRQALVVWITAKGSARPEQVVAGWLRSEE